METATTPREGYRVRNLSVWPPVSDDVRGCKLYANRQVGRWNQGVCLCIREKEREREIARATKTDSENKRGRAKEKGIWKGWVRALNKAYRGFKHKHSQDGRVDTPDVDHKEASSLSFAGGKTQHNGETWVFKPPTPPVTKPTLGTARQVTTTINKGGLLLKGCAPSFRETN